MAWLKETPQEPEEGSLPVWYWYYDFKDNIVEAIQLYHGCWKRYAYEGLWWDKPITPPKKPVIKTQDKTARRRKEK